MAEHSAMTDNALILRPLSHVPLKVIINDLLIFCLLGGERSDIVVVHGHGIYPAAD